MAKYNEIMSRLEIDDDTRARILEEVARTPSPAPKIKATRMRMALIPAACLIALLIGVLALPSVMPSVDKGLETQRVTAGDSKEVASSVTSNGSSHEDNASLAESDSSRSTEAASSSSAPLPEDLATEKPASGDDSNNANSEEDPEEAQGFDAAANANDSNPEASDENAGESSLEGNSSKPSRELDPVERNGAGEIAGLPDEQDLLADSELYSLRGVADDVMAISAPEEVEEPAPKAKERYQSAAELSESVNVPMSDIPSLDAKAKSVSYQRLSADEAAIEYALPQGVVRYHGIVGGNPKREVSDSRVVIEEPCGKTSVLLGGDNGAYSVASWKTDGCTYSISVSTPIKKAALLRYAKEAIGAL